MTIQRVHNNTGSDLLIGTPLAVCESALPGGLMHVTFLVLALEHPTRHVVGTLIRSAKDGAHVLAYIESDWCHEINAWVICKYPRL